MSSKLEKSAYQSLTPKQKAFVNAICADPNISATAAATKAGYKGTGIRVEAHRLLTNANIRKAFGEKLKDVGPSTQEIAHRWDRVSRATLDDFYTLKTVEVTPKIKQPLAETIKHIEADIAYQYDYMVRSWEVLGTDADGQAKDIENHEEWKKHRRLDILRHTMRLEKDPGAFRLIDGTPIMEDRLELDLVKAQKLGVLDLAKSIRETANGTGLEMRDPDAALDKLARIKGAYEKDNEQGRAMVSIHAVVEVVPAVAGVPLASSEKEVGDV